MNGVMINSNCTKIKFVLFLLSNVTCPSHKLNTSKVKYAIKGAQSTFT